MQSLLLNTRLLVLLLHLLLAMGDRKLPSQIRCRNMLDHAALDVQARPAHELRLVHSVLGLRTLELDRGLVTRRWSSTPQEGLDGSLQIR